MAAIMASNNHRWFVIVMLWFVCFLNYADRQAIFALFPLLRADLHLSDLQLALVGSSFMWMYAIVGLLAGWLGDWLSRKGLISAGLLLWIFVAAATVVARSYKQLVLLRALGGISEACFFPAAMSLISAYHGPQTRSRAMSILQSAVYTGTIAGGTIASIVGAHFGWRSNFMLFGALGLLLFFVLLIFLKEPDRGVEERASAEAKNESARISLPVLLADIFTEPLALRLMAVFIGANFVAMIFMVWLPSFLYRKFHMSLAMAGVSSTLYLQLASVGGVLLGGVMADMLARRNRGGRMMTQACGLLLGAPFLFLTGTAMSVGVLIAGMIGFGFCKGIYDSNIWASLHDVVRPECRATVVGITNSLGWLGGGIGPLILAAASERYGQSACLSATSVVYLLIACLLLWNARLANRRRVAG
ncbi:MAG TPA: MFS transporter [Terracidiphilus sp.]|nr:MFS transporter [Terracidiphilus sp.]